MQLAFDFRPPLPPLHAWPPALGVACYRISLDLPPVCSVGPEGTWLAVAQAERRAQELLTGAPVSWALTAAEQRAGNCGAYASRLRGP